MNLWFQVLHTNTSQVLGDFLAWTFCFGLPVYRVLIQ